MTTLSAPVLDYWSAHNPNAEVDFAPAVAPVFVEPMSSAHDMGLAKPQGPTVIYRSASLTIYARRDEGSELYIDLATGWA